MGRPKLEKLHRSELEALVVDMAKTQERFRRSIANIVREFEDEGDRVYLGSTNDADDLRDLDRDLTETINWMECPWMHGTDLWAELGRQRQLTAELLSAFDGVKDILGRAESNASGTPDWDHVAPRIAAVRDAAERASKDTAA